ncbi:MAG: hypothetical protein FWE62_00990 [Firmicutes bacterium]|nr:hypothetical protein [Bacillota bacterium]
MKKKEADTLFDSIDASLRYGTVRLPKLARVFLYTGFIVGLVFSIFCVFIAIFSEPNAIAVAIFFIILAIICFIVLARFYRLKKKIKLWLEDAVGLKARCAILGKEPPKETNPVLVALEVAAALAGAGSDIPPKIQVTFKYNGKVIKRISGKQGYSAEAMETGRSLIFKKFIGKAMDVLYSPEYDQVFLLKLDNSSTEEPPLDNNAQAG